MDSPAQYRGSLGRRPLHKTRAWPPGGSRPLGQFEVHRLLHAGTTGRTMSPPPKTRSWSTSVAHPGSVSGMGEIHELHELHIMFLKPPRAESVMPTHADTCGSKRYPEFRPKCFSVAKMNLFKLLPVYPKICTILRCVDVICAVTCGPRRALFSASRPNSGSAPLRTRDGSDAIDSRWDGNM